MKSDTAEWKPFFLHRLYDIRMGNKFDKNKLDEDSPEVNLVSRVSYNNGVDVKVGYVDGVEPFPAGLVTVALGGSYLGSCFVQEEPFYTAQNVAVMKPKWNTTHAVNLFISGLVRYESKEKYYAFGRELNTHIKTDFDVKLPIQHNCDGTPIVDRTYRYSDDGFVPDWQFMEDYIKALHHKPLTTKNEAGQAPKLDMAKWREFRIADLFRLEPTKGIVTDDLVEGDEIPYMAAKHEGNGIDMLCQKDGAEDWISDGNCVVFVNLGAGSAGYANYIKEDFIGMSGKTTCGYNANLNEFNGLFVSTILCQERPKYSFGRSWTGDRLKNTIIKLPATSSGEPDWKFMENYIKSLPYGDRLEG